MTGRPEGARPVMAVQPYDPGSFRDRRARVFFQDGRVLRALDETALADWQALRATRFYRQYVDGRQIVATEPVTGADLPPGNGWAGVLEHDPLPFISYPYEWCFGMLRDAARLQLDLLLAALEEEMILKDASPYNIQWRGARPVFIDIASFERLAPGEPWAGYRQFCQLYLYPLLLQAYKGVAFQPWLRGSLDGIPPEQCARLFSARDVLRRGVLTHVFLQAGAQARYARTSQPLKAELRRAGFDRRLIAANAQGLRRLIERLRWRPGLSAWADYAGQAPYEREDAERKTAFVRRIVAERPRRLVWDLGCNTGVFSRLAAERAELVVALDADQAAVERLYDELRAEGNDRILPLVADLADPSPGLGWRNRERTALAERGRPDLVLCLALVHHAVIGANIPLVELLEWLASLGGDLAIEFVTREDPMVQVLLRNKEDVYRDYDRDLFERVLGDHFAVEHREALASGTRVLYFGRARR